eukprot:CAMPEP_0183719954 /NCGR_PEP_ID=MMETSP0737-20130205/12713_1 /TAXON_ID=385413 /ORGANISM="Thalassiosira miniscula, Strain CCMP1093" /LENGTH=248 /DNA_ID=CAMNT_0025949747 /DNA_START=365 /DNA_END=1109 /DNA_ORIENTATION=+
MSPDDNSVSIRARVRKSKRAIDPEFDDPIETLVSFVAKNKRHGSLLLTPVPTVVPRVGSTSSAAGRTRSLSRGNMVAPMKRRHRSFGPNNRKVSTSSVASSASGADNGNNQGVNATLSDHNDGMVDVSLEDETPGTFVGGGGIELGASERTSATAPVDPLDQSHGRSPSANSLNASLHSHPGLPKHPSIHNGHNGSGSNSRYSSPLPVFRTSSNTSSVVSVARSDNGIRSQSAASAAPGVGADREGGG